MDLAFRINMPLVADRRDFVAPGICCARPDGNGRRHGFPTDTAYILVDEAGNEYPFGPSCVHQLGYPVDLRGIPDFTARDGELASGAGHHGGGPGHGGDASADAAARDLAIAKRYLLLRMDKVANIPGIDGGVRYAPLEDIYRQYRQTRELAPDSVARIIAIDRSEKTPDRFRTNNLLDVYTADVQLTRQIDRATSDSRRDFLTSVRDNFLRARLRLSSSQIAKAGLRLHRSAFGG
ncbi:hypothetical protein GCT19_09490 [Paraburkholderia sp. CNPSo 3155]|uniref:hypothetical protein n=1 Tax=Paraburkholderia atlantica TaxID=2654982 RepID=UPI00128D71C1|nr:hypothetical protein [Paraburkholderia atlantica]MPW05876.1 hypothetical protein [Paraburkholderia atlantica]